MTKIYRLGSWYTPISEECFSHDLSINMWSWWDLQVDTHQQFVVHGWQDRAIRERFIYAVA